MDKGFITKILDKFKCKNRSDYLTLIPIYDSDLRLEAYLRPITADYIESIPNCVELLSKWREENPTISSSVFKITHERTRRWIDERLINSNDRIVFMIVSLNGEFLGHIGLASFDTETRSADIDSVLRGVKGVLPGLMQHAVHTIMEWGRNQLGIENYALTTSADHANLIDFYKRCGFKEDYIIPLERVETADEIKWVKSSDSNLNNPEKRDVRMSYVRK